MMNTPKFEFDDNGYYPAMLERYLHLAEEILRNSQLQGGINIEKPESHESAVNNKESDAVRNAASADTIVIDRIINGISESGNNEFSPVDAERNTPDPDTIVINQTINGILEQPIRSDVSDAPDVPDAVLNRIRDGISDVPDGFLPSPPIYNSVENNIPENSLSELIERVTDVGNNIPEDSLTGLIDRIVMSQQTNHKSTAWSSEDDRETTPFELENMIKHLDEILSVNVSGEYRTISPESDLNITVEAARRLEEMATHLDDMKGNSDWAGNYHQARDEASTGGQAGNEVADILRELLPRLEDMVRAVEQNTEILSANQENSLELND